VTVLLLLLLADGVVVVAAALLGPEEPWGPPGGASICREAPAASGSRLFRSSRGLRDDRPSSFSSSFFFSFSSSS
jgi:hypothetical protein